MATDETRGRVYPPPKTTSTKKHLIEDISYSKDFIVCKCRWRGKTTEYDAHRKTAA